MKSKNTIDSVEAQAKTLNNAFPYSSANNFSSNTDANYKVIGFSNSFTNAYHLAKSIAFANCIRNACT